MMPNDSSTYPQTTGTASSPCQPTTPKTLTNQLHEIEQRIQWADLDVRMDINSLKRSLKHRQELKEKREELLTQIEENKKNKKK